MSGEVCRVTGKRGRGIPKGVTHVETVRLKVGEPWPEFIYNQIGGYFEPFTFKGTKVVEPYLLKKTAGRLFAKRIDATLPEYKYKIAPEGMLPMISAPRNGEYIILFGESGYVTTPYRCEMCRYDAEYRPLQPWVNHANDSFLDGGGEPIGWLPAPK